MKSDEELGLPWAGGQMEKRDLMGPSFIVEPLCGPGIPGGLPVIADWLLTQPSSFSVGEHKESTFPVTEFWPTACEWGNVYSKNAKMGSPRPNPCRDGLTATEPVVIHYLNTSRGKKNIWSLWKTTPVHIHSRSAQDRGCILYTSSRWRFLKCRPQRWKGSDMLFPRLNCFLCR